MKRIATGFRRALSSLATALAGKENRVARRLILLIIGFSSLITLSISIVQLTLEYRELRNDVDRQFDAIKVFLPNISAAVWDFDETQITLALVALVQQPHIERASVVASERSKRWSAGAGDLRNIVTRTYSLRHEMRGGVFEIGRLEVAASLTQIYRKVADRALTILFGNAVKTFMVALFTIYLFRRLVTRRLEELAVKVRKLAPEPTHLPSPAAPALPEGLDELQSVEWVLQDTTQKLDTATSALQSANLQLVEQIAEKEALLQNALVGIVMLRGGEIITCNRRFEEIFGYPTGASAGQSVKALFSSEQQWRAVDANVRDGRAAGLTATAAMIKHDGTQFWAEIAGSLVPSECHGGESIWIFLDVTERKSMEAEMVRLRAELWKMLESQLVRHTVAALAHEVNQPLASISALCEALQRKIEAGGCGAPAPTANDQLMHIIRRMALESERAGGIVRNLMATLQTPVVTVEPTALAQTLHDAARIAPSNGFADCELIIDCEDGLRPVMVNRQQLEKVLLNLIGNAAEAMLQAGLVGGRIWIEAGISDDGSAAHVIVRDEGPGVSKEMETQIFHPFITTKHGNLGMGLTISRSLIEALGGSFWLAAGDRPGAEFHFTLPFAD